MDEKGLTLIELLITISIIAILAASNVAVRMMRNTRTPLARIATPVANNRNVRRLLQL